MKKILILLFFLSLSSFAQTCFLSRSFAKSIEVLNQVYPNVGKIFVQKKLGNPWAYYKSDEIKKLINDHRLIYLRIPDFLNYENDVDNELFLCAGFEEMLSREKNVVFMKTFKQYTSEINPVISENFKPAYDKKSLTILPYPPLFFDENTMLLVYECYLLNAFVSPSGYVLYYPSIIGNIEDNPQIFLFVFKKIKEKNRERVVLVKLHGLYGQGLGKNIFYDNKKEVREFLSKLKQGERNDK